ncbi:pentapeptide repeat-containing protein [Umezakia ovalisporum]|jgi:uncharacterized protein YjbI with pentapeptide repeats|uniref:pentapeptide repeat-containing protein n=1 Tax=Umezakia ovalisporum TaxID=75695 RepID=UPI0024749DA1|nr:pentapeptide repeat-containing protein [Umezakia ovalisporum]MDH6084253.1 pentapeptide repeat-containing protein [Umezakia ovalisporum TAC611]
MTIDTIEEHLAILKQGVTIWNKWRESNSEIKPTLNGVDLSNVDITGAILTWTDLTSANLSGANLSNTNLSKTCLTKANLTRANLSNSLIFKSNLILANFTEANLNRANLSGSDITGAIFHGANLMDARLIMTIARGTNFTGSNLSYVNLSCAILKESDLTDSKLIQSNLTEANLTEADLSKADLTEANLSMANLDMANLNSVILSNANLSIVHALETNFSDAILTGACIEDWIINSKTNLNNIICDYIYLHKNSQGRLPIDRNFSTGEFTKLFQKASSIIELIFQNGVDWIAFTYSFGKLKIENEGNELIVKSIENKGDGIVVIKVSVPNNVNKDVLYKNFMQGYEFAHKVLEEKYKAELGSKEAQILQFTQENKNQQEYINNLFNLLQKLTSIQKIIAEEPKQSYSYYLQNSQVGGSLINAEIVNTQEITGNVHNKEA